MATSIKTIGDLPKFHVFAMTPPESRGVASNDFELSGAFDRMEGVNEGSCFLLTSDKGVLIGLFGELRFLQIAERTAMFHTTEESMPEVLGRELTYLKEPWKPHHIWMVDPRWTWKRTLYQAKDVISRTIRDNKVSIVDGQEVWDWIEIKRLAEKAGDSRYYPVFPDGRTTLPPAGPDGVIKGGWDHEHCELCEAHVDAGKYGYVDPGEHWVCEACYGKYVVNHDLSFMNP